MQRLGLGDLFNDVNIDENKLYTSRYFSIFEVYGRDYTKDGHKVVK